MINERTLRIPRRGRRLVRRRRPHLLAASSAAAFLLGWAVAASFAPIHPAAAWVIAPAIPGNWLARTSSTQGHVERSRRFAVAAPTSASSSSSSTTATTTTTKTTDAASSSVSPQPPLEPKMIVKLFGRLADKYLVLDSSGGNCCFSGCTGCEYRLEGGGYRMADSTSSRPKWIPTYASRLNSAGQPIESKWSQQLFPPPSAEASMDGAAMDAASPTAPRARQPAPLDYESFRSTILGMEYEPPLGGPSLPKPAAATVDDDPAIRRLWQILVTKKNKSGGDNDGDGDNARLSLRKMQRQWQRIASDGTTNSDDDNAGVTWKQFLADMQSEEQ